jgi:hypothetical protein
VPQNRQLLVTEFGLRNERSQKKRFGLRSERTQKKAFRIYFYDLSICQKADRSLAVLRPTIYFRGTPIRWKEFFLPQNWNATEAPVAGLPFA